jgi:general secretion pathway protein J
VRARGFTLIEVLIAVAITASIGALVVGTFVGVDRAGTVARAQGERYGAARIALTRMAGELSVAYVSERWDHGQFSERPTLFVGREDEVLFTAFAHQRLYVDAKESDQAVFEYRVDRDPARNGEPALFRRENARIDRDSDRGGRADPVVDDVTALRLSYWDATRKEWVREWSTRSVDRANELPSRVKIELELKMPGGRTETFTTQARIVMTKVLPDA